MTHKWYIIHAISGHEAKVAKAILEQAKKKGLEDKIEDVVVPTETVSEVRRGKKVEVEKKFLPGYILVKADMDENTWHLIKSISKVTGFLGASGRPQPIADAEAKRIFKQMEEGSPVTQNALKFEIGESIKVIDGPFESFVGVVEDVDIEKTRLKVSVSIFGRSTPVELEYSQVEKYS